MVLLGMRRSRVAFISPRTLPILSFNFGTSSEVSSQEGWFSADRHLLALKILGHKSRSPRSHAETLLDALLLTRNGLKVLPEGGPPGTHVVHGDGSFDYHEANFVLFGVTAEEIRWLHSGVFVPHVTDRPLRRRRHLRQWARRERRSRTRHCGATVLSSVRPVVLWAFNGPLPSLGSCARRVGGRRSRFAVPPASPLDGSTWTRPPRLSCAPAPLPFR